MKYFLDTEFIEGTQKKMLYETKPTIDLISIGIVCEDGREYYAISKEFNLKEAWNREWIKDNVLLPIFEELVKLEFEEDFLAFAEYSFNKKDFKTLLKKHGKSNKQIAENVREFVDLQKVSGTYKGEDAEFYGYYSGYDWVIFCWLFGNMIDLPKGFPMYCKDLKQLQDEHFVINREVMDYIEACRDTRDFPTLEQLKYIFKNEDIKKDPKYPKQTNEHNALADARWNYELYKFLNIL